MKAKSEITCYHNIIDVPLNNIVSWDLCGTGLFRVGPRRKSLQNHAVPRASFRHSKYTPCGLIIWQRTSSVYAKYPNDERSTNARDCYNHIKLFVTINNYHFRVFD